jgi:hypothetical protein
MPTNWNSNTQPETVEDFIHLLTAVKAQYGNLKVRRCRDGDEYNTDVYVHFDDIAVNSAPQSLITSNNDKDSYLVFVG